MRLDHAMFVWIRTRRFLKIEGHHQRYLGKHFFEISFLQTTYLRIASVSLLVIFYCGETFKVL